jgi:hypothetical protein|tara:strand:- start:1411 stop:1890 length:480 start_codon:yes stop_codon:yes gene_type:complete
MKLVESESTLIDYFEEENKLSGEEFENCLPKTKPNTFDVQKINYLLGNINICNKDWTNDLRTHYIKNNLELSTKQKLNLLVDNYKNYCNLPEDFLHSIAREKLGLPFDYHDIAKRRQQWLDKCKKEKEEDKQEDRFERELEKQKKRESTFKIEKKILTF